MEKSRTSATKFSTHKSKIPEIEARRQAAQQHTEDRQRRGREKYGEEKGERDALQKENQFKGDNKDRIISSKYILEIII